VLPEVAHGCIKEPPMTRRFAYRLLVLMAMFSCSIEASARGDAIYSVTNLGAVPMSAGRDPTDGNYPQYRDGVAPQFNGSGSVIFRPAYAYSRYLGDSIYNGPLPPGINDVPHALFPGPTTLYVSASAGNFSAGTVEGPINQLGNFQFVSNGTTARLLPGDLGQVLGINANGQLLAQGGLKDQLYNFTDGSLKTLLGLNGVSNNNSSALAINDSGQVVGRSNFDPNDPFGAMHAWLANSPGNGFPTDLNSLIDLKSGWVLNSASGISDDGRIVGVGSDGQGVLSYYLLTPHAVPEPGSVIVLAFGSVGLLLYRRRRARDTTV
jgi:PEP-CTERM motif